MEVKITGCKDPVLENELLRSAHFFGENLLSRKMLPHIDVEIVMRTTTKDWGSCTVTYYNEWYKPRQFEIILKRHKPLKDTIATLAHEMVHLKQFAKGEINIDLNRWHKTPIDTEVVPYHELPWEIEASTCEYILYDLYVQKYPPPPLTS